MIDWNHCRGSREAGRFGLPADAEHDRPSAGPARIPPPGPNAAALARRSQGSEKVQASASPPPSGGILVYSSKQHAISLSLFVSLCSLRGGWAEASSDIQDWEGVRSPSVATRCPRQRHPSSRPGSYSGRSTPSSRSPDRLLIFFIFVNNVAEHHVWLFSF